MMKSVLFYLVAVAFCLAPEPSAWSKEDPPPDFSVEVRVDFAGEPDVVGDVIMVLNSDDRPYVVDLKKTDSKPLPPLAMNLGPASPVVSQMVQLQGGPKSATIFVRGPGAPACRASTTSFKPDHACVPSKTDQQCGSISFNVEKDLKVKILCGKRESEK